MDKKLLIVLLLLICSSLYVYQIEQPRDQVSKQFDRFKLEHNKKYRTTVEENYRRIIFIQNIAKIRDHNSNLVHTYQLGVNKFADLTQQQFERTYLRLKVPLEKLITHYSSDKDEMRLASDIDWTTQGKVSSVKVQGECGSGWAFSTTGAIESAYLIRGEVKLLSQQQLVDCSGSYGNHGCQGGWIDYAFSYIKDYGVLSSQQYPYVGKVQACKARQGGSAFIANFEDTPGCDKMFNALLSRPVAVAVDASDWSLYNGGIVNVCENTINHGVLVVGVTNEYWKVKNSWGSTWGQSGFIRLARGNTCSICSYPSYPDL